MLATSLRHQFPKIGNLIRVFGPILGQHASTHKRLSIKSLKFYGSFVVIQNTPSRIQVKGHGYLIHFHETVFRPLQNKLKIAFWKYFLTAVEPYTCTRFFHKEHLYKELEGENSQKIKRTLRNFRGSNEKLRITVSRTRRFIQLT